LAVTLADVVEFAGGAGACVSAPFAVSCGPPSTFPACCHATAAPRFQVSAPALAWPSGDRDQSLAPAPSEAPSGDPRLDLHEPDDLVACGGRYFAVAPPRTDPEQPDTHDNQQVATNEAGPARACQRLRDARCLGAIIWRSKYIRRALAVYDPNVRPATNRRAVEAPAGADAVPSSTRSSVAVLERSLATAARCTDRRRRSSVHVPHGRNPAA